MQRRDRQGDVRLSMEHFRYHPGDGKGGFKLDVNKGMLIPERLENQRDYAINLLAWATKAVNYSNIAMQYIAAYHGHYGRPLNYSHHIISHNIKVNRANEAFKHEVIAKFKDHAFFVDSEELQSPKSQPDALSVTSTHVIPHDFDVDVTVIKLDIGNDVKPLRILCFTEENARQLIEYMVNKSRDISFEPAFIPKTAAEHERMIPQIQRKDDLIKMIISVPEFKEFFRNISPGNMNILTQKKLRVEDDEKVNNALLRALQIYLISPLGSEYHGAVKYPELHQMIVEYVANNSELLSLRVNPSNSFMAAVDTDPEAKRNQAVNMTKAEKFIEQLIAVIMYRHDTGALPANAVDVDKIRTYLTSNESSQPAEWLKPIVNELLTQYPVKYGELTSDHFAGYPVMQSLINEVKNNIKDSGVESDKSPRHKI